MKPNIIFVMTDQQRADLRKSRGFALDTMPFLDKWASHATDFGYAYTANPTCVPARVSMFTGRYPSATHVRSNANIQDAFYSKDLLDVVKEQGYQTAICGKNHSHRKPEDFDFHETNTHLGSYDLPYLSDKEKTFDSFIKTLKFRCSDTPSPYGVEAQLPYRNVSSALKFIDGVQEKPFFLWLSFAEPHNPYQVPSPYFDLFSPENLPPCHTSASDLPLKGDRAQWLRQQWETVYGSDIEHAILRSRSNYYGMLRLIDDQFKRLISELEARNLVENTIILYLSDHGDYVGEYGLIRKGVDLPQVLVNIPMIWKIPNQIQNGLCTQVMASCVDVLPTLCDLLQTQTPMGVQGKSLLPVLKNAFYDPSFYNTAYAEVGYGGEYVKENPIFTATQEGCLPGDGSFNCLNSFTQSGQCRMLIKEGHKIQMDMEGNCYLFDLKEDPFEINNLWNLPSYATIQNDLIQTLLQTVLKNADVLPLPRGRLRVAEFSRGG